MNDFEIGVLNLSSEFASVAIAIWIVFWMLDL